MKELLLVVLIFASKAMTGKADCSFEGKMYKMQEATTTCLKLKCIVGKSWTLKGMNPICEACDIADGVKVKTFDKLPIYTFPNHGNYTLVEEGLSATPLYGIFINGAACPKGMDAANCIETITFRVNEKTIIEMKIPVNEEHPFKINGTPHTMSSHITVNESAPELAYWKSSTTRCYNFVTPELSMRICKAQRPVQIEIWAKPKEPIENGLCGTYPSKPTESLKARDGTISQHSSPPPEAFLHSWKA